MKVSGVLIGNPPHAHKMVTSDLVYSPAQVTEHKCVELKDQSISEDTKRKFEELKKQFPKVFSLSNEDIGCTQLVTMDVDMGDSPPICQKLYTDRYRVPKFPHSSATFNIISGFRILTSPKVLQGALGDSACPTQCSQPCPMPANRHLTGLTWFPIVLYYIK